MKHILLLTFAILFSSAAYTQHAYYEALYLVDIPQEKLKEIKSSSIFTNEELRNAENYTKFFINPMDSTIGTLDFNLLRSALNKTNKSDTAITTNGSSGGIDKSRPDFTSIKESFSFNGNWQTVVFDELAKYYAEEFRKAQMVTYMQGFKQITTKIGEFEILFPQTYLKLKSADVASFPDLGAEYKRIFAEDLKKIPASLIRHISTYAGESGTDEDKQFKILNAEFVKNARANSNYQYFVVMTDIATRLTNGMHPSNLFQYLDANYYFSGRQDIVGVGIHGLNLLQKNLIDTTSNYSSSYSDTPTKVWIKIDDLRKLEKKKGWQYFIGLIYQQDKSFFSEVFFQRKNGKIDSFGAIEHDRFRKLMVNILAGFSEIETIHKSIETDSMQIQFGNYMSVVVKAINIINHSFDTQASQALAQFSTITDLTVNIFENARKKDFSTTVFYSLAAIRQLGVIDSVGEETLKTIERYGSFITDVVSADSTQIKGLIKKHAAPPTSFILKREYTFNISLTGQPGYFFAIERLNGPNHKPAFVSGLSLPLGFDFSFKYQSKRKPIDLGQNRGSFNLFMQFLDLGAILNFRLSDETSLLPDQVNFDQLFSPGFTFSWGFKNSPLTIGAGYQYSPKLREVTIEDGNGIFPNGHRIFARVSWDIPLLNIYHSKKKFWGSKNEPHKNMVVNCKGCKRDGR